MKSKYILAFLFMFGIVMFGAQSAKAESDSSDTSETSVSDIEESDESSVETDMKPAPRPLFPTRAIGEEKPPFFPQRPMPMVENMKENQGAILENIEGNRGELGDRMKMMAPGQSIAEIRKHVGERYEIAFANMYNLHTRLESRLEKMSAEGKDVDEEIDMLASAKSKLDTAKAEYEDVKAIFASEETDRESVQAASAELRAALVDLHGSFRAVVESLKAKFMPAV